MAMEVPSMLGEPLPKEAVGEVGEEQPPAEAVMQTDRSRSALKKRCFRLKSCL